MTPATLNEGRGVSPGDTLKIRPLNPPNFREGPLNEGRGVSPGDTRKLVQRPVELCRQALNEGRGVSPGDTLGPQANS